ncbi:TPA: erythromycin resistance leader peptide [Streptococcus pyogenes]|nr:erythromycin resistance leader peptide [Streptococcus pyogenes]
MGIFSIFVIESVKYFV